MKPVFFNTDESLYKKFKLVCGMNDKDVGKTITDLIQNYVTENKGLIDNPEVQEKLPPQLPTFLGEPSEWEVYIRKSGKQEIENIVTRLMFLRYLIHIHLIDRDNDSEIKNALRDPKFFKDSDDYKFLSKMNVWDQ